MKKLLLFAFLTMIIFSCQNAKKSELLVCTNPGPLTDLAVNKFNIKYPDVKVKFVGVNQSTGAPITITALLAAGTPPDFYIDHISRSGKFANSSFAIPVSKKIQDEFISDVIEPLKKGGDLYCVPQTMQIIGMFVNLDLLEKAGIKLNENWTIDEFLTDCEIIKEKLGITPMAFFAANQSSNEWIASWFSAFNVKYFNDDYSKVLVKETGGQKVFEFWKKMYEKGYISNTSSILTDDDARMLMLTNKVVFACDYVIDWNSEIKNMVDQKNIEKPFKWTMVKLPSVNGSKTPLLYQQALVVANNNKKNYEYNKYLLECFADDSLYDYLVSTQNQYNVKKTSKVTCDLPSWKLGEKLFKENGIYNCGMSLACYGEIRASLYPINQKLLAKNGITPEQAIKEFEEAIKKALIK